MTFKDYLEISSYFVTSISLVAIWITYAFSKKQIHFATMQKCISDFRSIEFEKGAENEAEKAKKYFELVNEELFYIENNYLPRVVAIEWLDGMIEYLPFLINNQSLYLSEKFKSLGSAKTEELLKDHPRIKKLINMIALPLDSLKGAVLEGEILGNYSPEHHKLLLTQMVNNLNVSYVNKWMYKRHICAVIN